MYPTISCTFTTPFIGVIESSFVLFRYGFLLPTRSSSCSHSYFGNSPYMLFFTLFLWHSGRIYHVLNFVPYIISSGEYPVLALQRELWVKAASCNIVGQFVLSVPHSASIHWRVCFKLCIVRSAWPSPWGWKGDERLLSIPRLKHIYFGLIPHPHFYLDRTERILVHMMVYPTRHNCTFLRSNYATGQFLKICKSLLVLVMSVSLSICICIHYFQD